MKKVVLISIVGFLILLCFACGNASQKSTSNEETTKTSSIEPSYEIILASEVEWTHLNPKRGDLAPKAGTLWGDRKGTEPTGFLLKPSDGFESPPHIHNVSYRGIVIQGFIHNDDPQATNMWMPAGSFWTQPKGEVHITAAKGSNALAYIEIEEGPYLVLPEHDHFDSGERPVNIDQSNIVWLGADDIEWVKNADQNKKAQMAFLWGEPVSNKLNGTLLSIPPNFSGKIVTQNSAFRAVVVKGEAQYYKPDTKENTKLPAGSFFRSDKKSYHTISNTSNEECLIYIRSFGGYEVK